MQKVHNFAEKGRQSTLQGSGQPGPAQCCRSEQADDKTVCSPDLSLRGGAADVAISGRQLRFRRECLVIRPYSARFPRRDAPRNDKLGSLAPMNLCRDHCRPAWRSLSAATDAIGVYVSSTACTGRQCLPEIAPSAAPPRNDKSGSLAPLNLCRLICGRPWRSMSAAANMVFRHAKGALRICSAPG